MTTLHTMNLALADLEGRLVRELQFSSDAEKQILDAIKAARECHRLEEEAMDNLERSIRAAFQERGRALSAAIGNGKPSPETVDADEPPRKAPKLVKSAGGEA